MTGDRENERSEALRISIVDVGHGNCTVISEAGVAVLIDAGSGAAVLEFLRSAGISNLEAVVISHADQDHVGGLIALLASRAVNIANIYINSDALKGTSTWSNLAYELDELQRTGGPKVKIGVVEGDVIPTQLVGVELAAVAPRHRLAQTGAGAVDQDNRRITSNTMSVVLKVLIDGNPVVLLPGDLDWTGFLHLKATRQDLKAEILVVPHHGGNGGTATETAQLTDELCAAVKPREVVISNGRGRHNNPRPAVVRAVRETLPAVHIACTQVSKVCLAQIIETTPRPEGPFSAGSEGGSCCAGTIELRRGDGIGSGRDTSDHDSYVDLFATTALCRLAKSAGH